MLSTFKRHWPEYLMEAAELALFMMAVSIAGVACFDSDSPIAQAAHYPVLKRLLMGCALGVTAFVTIHSPWGRQSGAHFNPAVTLTYFRLGKIAPCDAAFYILFQFAGGAAGVWFAAALLGQPLASPSVDYIVTIPGPKGTTVAFVAEFAIAFLLMTVVLISTNRPRLAAHTAWLVSGMIVVFYTLESPLSGASMNPARTFASALSADVWHACWVYFLAPPLAMLTAAEVYLRVWGPHNVFCAKLFHSRTHCCIFRCGYAIQGAEAFSRPIFEHGRAPLAH